MNYYALIGLFNGIVVLATVLALSLRKPRIHHYKSFVVFSLSVGLWSVAYAIWQMQTEYSLALFWMRLAMLLIYPACFGFLIFSMEVCGFQVSRAIKMALIAVSALSVVFGFSPWMVQDVKPQLNFLFWPVPGMLMHFYVFLFCVSIAVSFVVLIMTWHRSVGAHRWQLQWIILSMAPAWVGGSTNWLLWYGVDFPPAPNFFVGVGWLLLAYAMIRTRFFDVDVLADYVQEARLSAIGLLTASIHHEIKSPVFVIRGLAESIAEKGVSENAGSPQVQDAMVRIIQQTERITEIIRKFRDFATRPKSQLLKLQCVELKQVVRGVLAITQSQLDANKVELAVSIPDNLSVYVDQYSLEEILINLILNACQALKNTKQPAIKLSVRSLDNQRTNSFTKHALHSTSSVAVTIEDNGPGMSEKELSRLFEPFYTTKEEGTGLGLYVVKELARRNQAEIKVESVLGGGTKFSLTFKPVIA